jgi:hypothetical protein
MVKDACKWVFEPGNGKCYGVGYSALVATAVVCKSEWLEEGEKDKCQVTNL